MPNDDAIVIVSTHVYFILLLPFVKTRTVAVFTHVFLDLTVYRSW